MSDAPTQKGHGCAESSGHACSSSWRLVLPFKVPESCRRGASTRLLPGLGVTHRPSGHTDPALLTRRARPSPTKQTRGPCRTVQREGSLSRIQEPGPCTWSGCDGNSPTRHPSSRRSVRDSCGLHGHRGPTLTLPSPQKPEGGQSPPLQAEPPAALAHKTPWGL